MKNKSVVQQANSCMQPLSSVEMLAVEGGSFWADIAYVTGVISRCYYEFVTQASAYQSSLPPNLKK
ncbi:MAG: hypothetical protein GXC72_02190 [Chitinophagaceae bacterium]|jgi:hypothetical protein|nr:hypothetical protein [Chitinophagaceae bacterium]